MKRDGGPGAKRKGHILTLNGNKHLDSHLRWQDQEVTLNISSGPFICLNIYINKNYFLPYRKVFKYHKLMYLFQKLFTES